MPYFYVLKPNYAIISYLVASQSIRGSQLTLYTHPISLQTLKRWSDLINLADSCPIWLYPLVWFISLANTGLNQPIRQAMILRVNETREDRLRLRVLGVTGKGDPSDIGFVITLEKLIR